MLRGDLKRAVQQMPTNQIPERYKRLIIPHRKQSLKVIAAEGGSTSY